MLYHLAPVPGVITGSDLRVRTGAAFVLEQHIIQTVLIERRIQVDQVHAIVFDAAPQNIQIIAVVKRIFHETLP
jgi:hypothetical protein